MRGLGDLATGLVVVAAVVGAMYLVGRRRIPIISAWADFATAEEPDGTGVDFQPAWVHTAATDEPVFTGEVETHQETLGNTCNRPTAQRLQMKGCLNC